MRGVHVEQHLARLVLGKIVLITWNVLVPPILQLLTDHMSFGNLQFIVARRETTLDDTVVRLFSGGWIATLLQTPSAEDGWHLLLLYKINHFKNNW